MILPNKPVRIFDLDKFIESLRNSSDTWVVQPKWNGHRALVYCDAEGKITVYSRLGTPLSLARGKFSWLSILEIPRPFLLDGELTRSGRLIVWDIIVRGGEQLISLPYEARYEMLEVPFRRKLVKGKESIEAVETIPYSQYAKFLLRRADEDVEGIVFKRLSAKDFWGPHKTRDVGSQVKFKF